MCNIIRYTFPGTGGPGLRGGRPGRTTGSSSPPRWKKPSHPSNNSVRSASRLAEPALRQSCCRCRGRSRRRASCALAPYFLRCGRIWRTSVFQSGVSGSGRKLRLRRRGRELARGCFLAERAAWKAAAINSSTSSNGTGNCPYAACLSEGMGMCNIIRYRFQGPV
jgi:hypothetical protein